MRELVIFIIVLLFPSAVSEKETLNDRRVWRFVSACQIDSSDPYLGRNSAPSMIADPRLGLKVISLTYVADWSAPQVWIEQIVESSSEKERESAIKNGLPVWHVDNRYFISWPIMGTVCLDKCSEEKDVIFEFEGGVLSQHIGIDILNYLKDQPFYLLKNTETIFHNKYNFEICNINYVETKRYMEAIGRQ